MVTKETEILDKIQTELKINFRIQRDRRLWMSIQPDRLIKVSKWLKENGFLHISAISVTDWLKEGKYELTYHLWSYDDKILLTLKTKIDRKNPVIDSVESIFKESAQIHERELHELFGVKFKNNSDLSPLFLENWNKEPPFKKDFNWRDYVRNEFYSIENEREKVYYD